MAKQQLADVEINIDDDPKKTESESEPVKQKVTSQPRSDSKKKKKQKRVLILVTSDKGGCGKSTLSRALVDRLNRRGIDLDCYDTDTRNPQLHRHYKDVGAGVKQVDIGKSKGFDKILNDLERCEAKIVLVDLAAGASRDLESIESELGLFDSAKELGFDIVFFSVLSRVKDSVFALKDLMRFTGGRADHIVVRNLFFGDPDQFSIFNNGKTRETVESSNGIVINLPNLSDETFHAVDANSLPFSAAESNLEQFSERKRVSRWLLETDKNIDACQSLLGL